MPLLRSWSFGKKRNERRKDPAKEFEVLPTHLAHLYKRGSENDNLSGVLTSVKAPSQLFGRIRREGIQVEGLLSETLEVFRFKLGRNGQSLAKKMFTWYEQGDVSQFSDWEIG